MRILVYLVICLFLFSACEKDNEVITGPAPNQQKETFAFKSITYAFEEGDTIEKTEHQRPTAFFYNRTSADMNILFKGLDGISDMGQFQSSDSGAFPDSSADTVKVNAPERVYPDKSFSLGSKRWNYGNNLQQQPVTNRLKLDYKASLSPSARLALDENVITESYTLTYYATFVSNTGREINVKGKWKGRFAVKNEVKLHYTEIK